MGADAGSQSEDVDSQSEDVDSLSEDAGSLSEDVGSLSEDAEDIYIGTYLVSVEFAFSGMILLLICF